jgi:hypothetical protein
MMAHQPDAGDSTAFLNDLLARAVRLVDAVADTDDEMVASIAIGIEDDLRAHLRQETRRAA